MKKVIVLLLILTFSTSIVACNKSNVKQPNETNSTKAASEKENNDTSNTNNSENQDTSNGSKNEESTPATSAPNQTTAALTQDNTSKTNDTTPKQNNSTSSSNSDSNSTLSNEKKAWYFMPVTTHKTPAGAETQEYLSKFSAHYLGDTSRKVIYLTFDEGNTQCYTNQILDTLKKHNAKATFFLTEPYILANPTIVKRMIAEGHKVGNHTNKHLSMPTLAGNKERFTAELTNTNDAFKKLTGRNLDPLFRFPMGEYSEKSLQYVKDLGYNTYFWSFAYNDYTPSKPPTYEYTKNRILSLTHNGAIMLLHASCKTNADVLDEVISTLAKQGYSFESVS